MSQELNVIQGSPEWLALRKTKVTATDAPVVMGVSPWKSIFQLYEEKVSTTVPTLKTAAMQRGIELEPIARDLFQVKTGKKMTPKVFSLDWAMASLDGISEQNEILEIKCPGPKDHAVALSGKVPDYYFPQLQHQLWVCGAFRAFYFSFDGVDGVTVEVERDEAYIAKMIAEEYKFYLCMKNETPPAKPEDEYIERNDEAWRECAAKWKAAKDALKMMEAEEEDLRNSLIYLSGNINTKGSGVSLFQVTRKGAFDYAKVPQLKGIDLEPYRKPPTTSWRITCQ